MHFHENVEGSKKKWKLEEFENVCFQVVLVTTINVYKILSLNWYTMRKEWAVGIVYMYYCITHIL
jgi:hypothetical protein